MTEAEKKLKEFSKNLKSAGAEEVIFRDDSLFIKDIETVLNVLEEAREYIKKVNQEHHMITCKLGKKNCF